jgi:hypothetical protein
MFSELHFGENANPSENKSSSPKRSGARSQRTRMDASWHYKENRQKKRPATPRRTDFQKNLGAGVTASQLSL